jgi:DNA-binding XRE family transcriptional regulator
MELEITSKDVRDYRTKNNLTLMQLAEAVCVDKQTLHRWEKGKIPKVKTAGFAALVSKIKSQEPAQ